MDTSFLLQSLNDNVESTQSEIFQIEKTLLEHPDDFIALRKKAKLLLKLETTPYLENALELINSSLKISPSNFDSTIVKTKILRYLKRYDDALDCIDYLEHDEPDSPDFLEEKSLILLLNNRNNEAQYYLEKLESVSEDRAFCNRGLYWFNKKS